MALLLVVAAAMSLTGCAMRPPVAVAVVVTSNVNEQAPVLAPADRDLLSGLGADPDVPSATAVVIAAGRPGAETVDLLPRRPNGQVEHGPRRDTLLAGRVDAVQQAVDRATAEGTDDDRLRALDAAARSGAGTVVVLGGGLSTTDPLDLRVAGFDQDPDTIAAGLQRAGRLPDLTGRVVVLSGLGRTAGAQPPLGVAEQRYLRALWVAVCTRAGGWCSVEDGVRSALPSRSTVTAPVVDVPAAGTQPGPQGGSTVSVPAPLLFRPDSCTVIDPEAAAAVLGPLATTLRTGRATVTVSGRTAPVGPGDGVALSTCRARAAADVLRGLGVPETAFADVRGDGSRADPPSASRDAAGRLDPGRLSALRRVLFTVTPQEAPR